MEICSEAEIAEAFTPTRYPSHPPIPYGHKRFYTRGNHTFYINDNWTPIDIGFVAECLINGRINGIKESVSESNALYNAKLTLESCANAAASWWFDYAEHISKQSSPPMERKDALNNAYQWMKWSSRIAK